MKDFSYYDSGLFTMFVPNTKEAEHAWCELASVTDGTGKVLSIQKNQFIHSLKQAGYSVGKGKKPTESIDDILNQLL